MYDMYVVHCKKRHAVQRLSLDIITKEENRWKMHSKLR